MGNSKITLTAFPKQGDHLGKRTDVCFHYGAGGETTGVVVRDDMEDPWLTIIRLDDGRHVLATECQYSPKVSQGETAHAQEPHKTDWRKWLLLAFTFNKPEAMALSDDELKLHICKMWDALEQEAANRLEELTTRAPQDAPQAPQKPKCRHCGKTESHVGHSSMADPAWHEFVAAPVPPPSTNKETE